MFNPIDSWLKRWQRGNAEFISTFSQASALLRHAEGAPENWSNDTLQTLKSYISLVEMPLVQRVNKAMNMGLRRGSFILQLSFYIRLLTIRTKA
jgi:hypothetical protein